MTDSPADIIRRAKAKIEDPAHWCQGVSARNEIGVIVDPNDSFARQWCVVGALSAVTGSCFDAAGDTHRYLTRAAHEIGKPRAQDVNDETDHPTTMRFIDRAIALAEQESE